ncbi:MAG: STAS domain-containing protein [Betaproteobacteria bacterium]|nr:STAS domain-containing protein [Betaproteobacteria bacterium]
MPWISLRVAGAYSERSPCCSAAQPRGPGTVSITAGDGLVTALRLAQNPLLPAPAALTRDTSSAEGRGISSQAGCNGEQQWNLSSGLPVRQLYSRPTSDQFRDRVLALVHTCTKAQQAVVLDFSSVDYISSAGLRVLMLAAKQARASGGTVALAALQPVVLEIFQISRFDKVLACHPGIAEALAAVGAGG